ncbi:MAG: four helix bundle protein [Bacteroidota bacterium]
MGFHFEQLKVWQRAVDLTADIHKLTLSFPKDELFILTSQIKRASDSVALNIAEGSTGQTKKEFGRFLGIAIRSAIEVVTCLYIGKKRNLINNEQFEILYKELNAIVKMTQALRKSLTTSDKL